MNFLIELLLFPIYIVLVLMFIVLTVLVLPLKIPFVRNYIYKHISPNTTNIDK